MDLRTTERIEAAIDGTAAMLLAGAAAFALMRASEALSSALAGAAVAFLPAFLVLRAVRPKEPEFALARFDCAVPSVREFDELVLSELHRVAARVTEELVLEDALADPEPDSRVVRLFDAAAMPADQEGFDSLLSRASAAPPDASQALHQALTKLRNSLR
jgi:hypothetical protein